MLSRFFKRKEQFVQPAPDHKPHKGQPPRTSPLMPRAGDDLIREALPRVFQRTGKDFMPITPEGARAASMDAGGAAPRCESMDAGGLCPSRTWGDAGGTAPRCESMDERPEADHKSLPDVWGIQNTVPAVVFSWFAAHSFIGHQACAILAQHWLIDKACSQAPVGAVRNGFTAVPGLPSGAVPPEVAREIAQINRDMKILDECREFSRNSRIFGIRHALFLVDGIDYEAPFNPDGVAPGAYKGISQIDPYWLTPEFDRAAMGDPAAKHFYEPTWWRLPSGQRVHRSHFVISRESEVPDLLKPTYYYGGLPLPQLIFERVYAAERTADEAPELALTKRLITMKGEIENYITDESEVTDRLNAFNQIRSNFGFLVVGQDETVNQIDTGLADFDALIMTQYQLVAAIARTPATELLGTTPKGFNSTGNYEADSYDQELANIQANGMTPLADRHHLLLCRSHFPEYPELAIKTEWNPVRKLKPNEVADINLKNARTAQIEAAVGAISGDEERDRLRADQGSPWQNL